MPLRKVLRGILNQQCHGVSTRQEQQLPPKATEIDAFFAAQVRMLQRSLDGFDARLAWFTPGAKLPAAAIGDPAKDYKSSGLFGDGHCGTFRPGEQAAAWRSVCISHRWLG